MGWHPLERLERMLSAYRSSFPWVWTPIKGFQCFPGEFNWWPIPVAGIVWQWEFKKIQLVDRQGKPPPPQVNIIRQRKFINWFGVNLYFIVYLMQLTVWLLLLSAVSPKFVYSTVVDAQLEKRVHEKKQWRMDLYVRQLSGSCRLS